MRKKTLIFLFLLAMVTTLPAQVGINTSTPLGVLHIDPKGDTNGMSGIVDDLIVSSNGNIGLGTSSPQAKLHPVNNGTVPLLRIEDGTQAAGHILHSDASGNASWAHLPGPDARVTNINPSSVVTFSNGTYSFLTSVPVTISGNFLITIRWWGVTQTVVNNYTAAEFYICESTNATANWAADQHSIKDRADYYVMTSASKAYCFSTSLYARIESGKNMKVYIRVIVGNTWQIGTISSNATYNPSIVVFRI